MKFKTVCIDAVDVKDIRNRIGISQTKFAELLNVSTIAVQQWEQGARNPTGATKVLLELFSNNPDLVEMRMVK